MDSKWLSLSLAAALVAGTACSNGSGQVSVSAKSTAATDAGASSLDLGNGIILNRVRVAIQKVKLEGAVAGAPDAGTPGDGGADDPAGHHLVASASRGSDDGADAGSGDAGHGGDDDADEVRVGPFLVDLAGGALAGSLNHILDGLVPAGTYRELKVVVGVVPPAQAGANVGLADMSGRSVILEGTLDGKPFTFESSLHAELELETTLTVAAGGTTANVTLSIDPSAWFKAADGSRLDPTAASSKSQIEANIKASVDAFDDDDRDGHDDHGGHGADDGSGHQ